MEKKKNFQTDYKLLDIIQKKSIVTFPLQRMMLNLLRYDIKIDYVPGKCMLIAETLSRAYLKDPIEDDTELENIVHSIAKHLAIKGKLKLMRLYRLLFIIANMDG